MEVRLLSDLLEAAGYANAGNGGAAVTYDYWALMGEHDALPGYPDGQPSAASATASSAFVLPLLIIGDAGVRFDHRAVGGGQRVRGRRRPQERGGGRAGAASEGDRRSRCRAF